MSPNPNQQLDEGHWMRCRGVEIQDGNLICEVDWSRTYEIEKAYPKDPHLQYLNCATAEDLQRFTRAWGRFTFEPQGAR